MNIPSGITNFANSILGKPVGALGGQTKSVTPVPIVPATIPSNSSATNPVLNTPAAQTFINNQTGSTSSQTPSTSTGNTSTTPYANGLQPNDASNKYNTATGQLNPNYIDPNATSTNTPNSAPATVPDANTSNPNQAYTDAYNTYIKALSNNTDVSNAQTAYNNFTANENLGVTDLEGQGRGIPLSLIRGQQAKLQAQAEPEATRLQNAIGIAQGNQANTVAGAKAGVDLQTSLQDQAQNALANSKPISVGIGSTAYQLNPATGKYEPLSSSGGSTENDTSVTSAYVDGINNGSITSIASVPAQYRNDVAVALAKTGVTTPLADSRNALASTRIAANFINLPQYQLTANGLPYLQRIAADMQTPGSISDQSLLDAFTKLSTSGNAISDAQVKVITDGKSLSDTLSVLANKLANGGVLSDNQRTQLQKIAQAEYANYQKGYQPVYDQVTSQLKAAGIPEQFWTIPDLNKFSSQSGLDSNTNSSSDSSSAPLTWDNLGD